MSDVRENDVEAPFVDGRVSREREALRYHGDDGRIDLCAAVIRDGRFVDELVHDDGLHVFWEE